jgi:hypothetical protein
LHRANARIELARSSAMVGGPAVGGALVTALSAPVALLADAASFVGSALLIGSVRGAEPSQTAPRGARRNWRVEMSAGAAHIRRTPLLAAVIATVATNNLSRSVAMAIAVLYLVDVGGLDGAAIGLTWAIGPSTRR